MLLLPLLESVTFQKKGSSESSKERIRAGFGINAAVGVEIDVLEKIPQDDGETGWVGLST